MKVIWLVWASTLGEDDWGTIRPEGFASRESAEREIRKYQKNAVHPSRWWIERREVVLEEVPRL